MRISDWSSDVCSSDLDEGAGADRRAVLQEAVVVAGDGAGADVGGGADGGVAQIAQVVGLGALAQLGVLDLDEVDDMGAAAELGPRTQPREGAEHHAVATPGAPAVATAADLARSDKRRVGKACASTCRTRWCQHQS